jgi:hypothetical protein
MRRLVNGLVAVALGLYIALIVLALFSDRLLFQAQSSSYQDKDLITAKESRTRGF